MSDQEMKLRFFGLHFGCSVLAQNKIQPLYGVATFGGNEKLPIVATNGEWLPLRHVQLVLKPLSEITDEDAIECAKICEPFYDWKIEQNDEIATVVYSIDDGLFCKLWIWKGDKDDSILSFSVDSETLSFRQFEMIDFLRFKGYCLPFMGENPFTEGWAVPATVNQPTGANS